MATKRKGMSGDEKQATLLGLFHDSCEVFNKIELEKRGAAAGVVEKTVMENVAALVDDRKVLTDKIGAGVFFWAFPSSEFISLGARTTELEALLLAETAASEAATARLSEIEADPVGAAERASKLSELDALRARVKAAEISLKALADSDPDVTKAALAKAKLVKAGADRWTDALWAIKSTLINKYSMEPGQAASMLGMNDAFDYAA
jgi:hypothetical protein